MESSRPSSFLSPGSFGALFSLPDPLIAFFQENGLNLPVQHGDACWHLPMPSAFVMDRDGIITYAYVSADVTDRAEPEALLAQIRAIDGPAR